MLGDIPWPFLQTTTTALTVSGTQAYVLPGNMARLVDVYILVGTIRYTPTEVTSFDDWNRLNAANNIQSDTVTYYFIQGNQILFWPTPSSSSNTITYEFLQSGRDISVADYTTGKIAAVTNGSATVTGGTAGDATSWTAGMAGKYIRITSTSADKTGDGLWYKIASVTNSNTLVLSAVYTGTTFSAGSVAYTIGDVSLIPEKYQIGPVYYATAQYWRKENDPGRADRFEAQFNETLVRMKREEGTKGTSVVVDDNTTLALINPNLNKSAT